LFESENKPSIKGLKHFSTNELIMFLAINYKRKWDFWILVYNMLLIYFECKATQPQHRRHHHHSSLSAAAAK